MAKPLQRQFRNRRLTSDEIAADEEIRTAVRDEFPPATKIAPVAVSITEWLREAIQRSNKRVEDLAAAAGVAPRVIDGFLSGRRDIRMETADRLVAALEVEIAAHSQ